MSTIYFSNNHILQDTYIKNVDIPVSKEKLLDDLNKWDTFFKSAHKIPRPVLPDYSHHLQSAMNLLGSEVGNYIIKNGINPEDIINFINDHDIIHHPKILSSIRKPDRRWKRQSSGKKMFWLKKNPFCKTIYKQKHDVCMMTRLSRRLCN